MQVVGEFIATVGWLGLALIASEIGATLIYELGQWVGFRLTGARVVRWVGFRYQLSRVAGHWRFQRPLAAFPHLVADPPDDATRFNHAAYCFGGGLFSLLTVILSLVTLIQFKLAVDLWFFILIIWIWVNTLKVVQLLPMNWRGRPTAAKEFMAGRASQAAVTAAYVTAKAHALKIQTGSVATLDARLIVMPRDGGNRNYLVVRQAALILEWGLQHGLAMPELLTGLARLEPSFNTIPTADLARYLNATLYWNLATDHATARIISWYHDAGVQRVLRRYQPLQQFRLTAVFEWRVNHQQAAALSQITAGLKHAQRVHDLDEVAVLKALQTRIESSSERKR
ncbi:hypothetical protein [Lactiplantibacillus modestisalitolerans]|uniref:Uncharacterized protein n=1 Tax=Lactiplantibacillus modestisalitolerans TaxID=1457219 RepID=A0ABV5WUX1_9LACO|nr:hypothetical protein [Lactiplantibacillus modestisalitolerans]